MYWFRMNSSLSFGWVLRGRWSGHGNYSRRSIRGGLVRRLVVAYGHCLWRCCLVVVIVMLRVRLCLLSWLLLLLTPIPTTKHDFIPAPDIGPLKLLRYKNKPATRAMMAKGPQFSSTLCIPGGRNPPPLVPVLAVKRQNKIIAPTIIITVELELRKFLSNHRTSQKSLFIVEKTLSIWFIWFMMPFMMDIFCQLAASLLVTTAATSQPTIVCTFYWKGVQNLKNNSPPPCWHFWWLTTSDRKSRKPM